MLKYLIFLLIGGFLGFLTRNIDIKGVNRYVMLVSILLLLFFMGVGIGKDPQLKTKIINFGVTAFTISFFTVAGSIASVYLIVKLFGKKE